MTQIKEPGVLEAGLESLGGVREDSIRDRFAHYIKIGGHTSKPRPQVALAAALVETGLELQGLGARVATAPDLLVGDLCLARASRLLADADDLRLQVAFARTVEACSAAAAGGGPVPSPRPGLEKALEDWT